MLTVNEIEAFYPQVFRHFFFDKGMCHGVIESPEFSWAFTALTFHELHWIVRAENPNAILSWEWKG